MPPQPEFATIIEFDVTASGSRPVELSRQMREDLRAIVSEALAAASVSLDDVLDRDNGDGMRLILFSQYPANQVLGTFFERIDPALRAHRLSAAPAASLRLRVAVDQGPVYRDATGWDGPQLVRVARMLDAKPVRRALADYPVTNYALIVSEDVYQHVIRSEWGPSRDAFGPVKVRAKETKTQAWKYVPGVPPAMWMRRHRLRLRAATIYAAAVLLLAILGVVATVATPEIRCFFGLGGCTSHPSAAATPPPSRSASPAASVGNGVVQMSPCLNMHSGPDINTAVLVCIPYGTDLRIDCTAQGTLRIGYDGKPTTIWDHTTYAGKSGYVTDGYLSTGGPAAVAGPC